MAKTPPPAALKGVPKEAADEEAMPQPALEVWLKALMSQFRVLGVPREPGWLVFRLGGEGRGRVGSKGGRGYLCRRLCSRRMCGGTLR